MKKENDKLAVLLPGIGYTCDKPLLYYSGKLARALHWDVFPVLYTGFPAKVRGDRERMKQSVEIALTQTEKILREVEWADYDEVLFISKSIGTVVASLYDSALGLSCRHILFTPVEETFTYPMRDAIAFHGTADPWADTACIRRLCDGAHIPLFITENANHSLETGDIELDIKNLMSVMQQVRVFMLSST